MTTSRLVMITVLCVFLGICVVRLYFLLKEFLHRWTISNRIKKILRISAEAAVNKDVIILTTFDFDKEPDAPKMIIESVLEAYEPPTGFMKDHKWACLSVSNEEGYIQVVNALHAVLEKRGGYVFLGSTMTNRVSRETNFNAAFIPTAFKKKENKEEDTNE